MSSRPRSVAVSLVVSLLLWGIVWPIVSIMMNVRTGHKIKEALLVSLKEKYPGHAFSGGVGKGSSLEEGPGVGIDILSKSDPQVRKEMLNFITEEIEDNQYGASFYVDFELENKRFVLYKSRKKGLEWEEERAR